MEQMKHWGLWEEGEKTSSSHVKKIYGDRKLFQTNIYMIWQEEATQRHKHNGGVGGKTLQVRHACWDTFFRTKTDTAHHLRAEMSHILLLL